MPKYNYRDIKKQFRLLLAAINEGQQSVDFDWYDCCDALSETASAKLNIDDFLDFESMMENVHVYPVINAHRVYNYNHIAKFKEAKQLAITNPPDVFPYFMWNNYIYDAKTSRRLCNRIKADIPATWGP